MGCTNKQLEEANLTMKNHAPRNSGATLCTARQHSTSRSPSHSSLGPVSWLVDGMVDCF